MVVARFETHKQQNQGCWASDVQNPRIVEPFERTKQTCQWLWTSDDPKHKCLLNVLKETNNTIKVFGPRMLKARWLLKF